MATIDFDLTEEQKTRRKQLESEHKREVYFIKAGGVEAWYKGPSEEDIDAFMADSSDQRTSGSAALDLARKNLIDGEAKQVFAKRPGAIVPHANAYAKACGIAADGYLGK
ncbi:hypothetical protein WMF30_10395 [Sorangium sp. So ce134]